MDKKNHSFRQHDFNLFSFWLANAEIMNHNCSLERIRIHAMGKITFQFDQDKAISVMAYFLQRLGPMDKLKLVKLLYFADRESFLRRGYPLTGDRQVAMQHGPVPSRCLDTINLNMHPTVVREHNTVMLRGQFPTKLSQEDTCILDDVIDRHGHRTAWQLRNDTHELPEYKETYVEGTSTTIPYESLLRLYGNDRQFRHGRPVISPSMAKHMICPFSDSDADL